MARYGFGGLNTKESRTILLGRETFAPTVLFALAPVAIDCAATERLWRICNEQTQQQLLLPLWLTAGSVDCLSSFLWCI